MKPTQFTYKDRNGTVSMEVVGQILRVSFSGACGSGMSKQFFDALSERVSAFGNKPWAYLSVSPDFVAATPEAIEWICKAYKYSIANGCRSEAYVIQSALVKSQIQTLMEKGGSNYGIDDVLFNSEADAIDAIQEQLRHAELC